MANFHLFFKDEGKHRAEDVRWALQSFCDGIIDYFEETFSQFHSHLYNNVVNLRGQCTQKCSQKKKNVADWCSLCSKWRDAILDEHQFKTAHNSYSFWKNIDSTKWPSNVKEVQKVFLPSFYKGKLNTSDLSICLNIMTNCTLFINRQELKVIRDIRNKFAHASSSINVTEKKEYIEQLLSYLSDNNLKTYRSVQQAIKHLNILNNHSIRSICEQDLFEEQERLKIEKKIYGRRNRCHYFITLSSIFVVLTSLIMAFSYKWDNINEERIWTPGQPSFFFTSHADFVGREWLKRKIRDYLNQGTNGVILVAEPGFGKSAVVANFIQTYEDNGNLSLLGYHICQHDSRLSLDVSNFIINLWRSLRKKYVDFNAEIPTTLKRENDMKSYCTMDPIYCFQELIAHPLKSVNISKRSLYIIDAIDECQQSSFGWSISELLINKHKFLIPPLSIFMTSRNKSTLLQRFRTFKQLHVEPNSSENKGDLKQFIRYKAGSDYNRNVLDDMTNFLILRHYLFNFHDTHAERIKRVYEIYDFEFSRLYGNGFSRKYAIDRSFFEVLCTNLLIDDSLTLNIMKEVLKYSYPSPDDEEFEKMIDRVTTNIVRLWEKDGIKTIHSSLFDWLKFKKNKNFLVNIKRGHYLWAMYLFNKLKTNSIKPIINQYERNKIMTQTMSLVDHYVLARNESLQNELLTGKFKIPDIRLSCLSCLSALPSIPMFYNGTISHVEYAVYHFYEYNIFKTLILLSRTTNWTKEAFMAFHCDNTGAFTAFLEFGHVDFKQKHVIVDTWRTFGNTNMPGIEYDLNREENVDGVRLSRKQMLLNVVGKITVEYMSIFHLMMMKNQLQELHSVVSRDKSVLGEKTGNGWDVFDVAVSFNNIQLLNFLQNFKTMEKNFWYLWYASVHGSTSIVENLLDEGFRDECVKCNLSLNNDEVYRGMYEHFLEYSTTKTNTYDSANAYKFRRFFLCESALLVAVKRGKYKVVKTLLLSGSQCLEHTDAFGFTPLGAAVYFRHDSVIKLLLSYGANVNFVVKSLLNSSDVDIFNRFLRFPLEKKWNTQNAFNGATIFHLSALKPTCSSTILLGEILQTQKNTNLDVKDSNGHSPLYYAICHPEADNTYATMEDFLQSKSHRMVFFLIEAFNSQQISDSLLKLGICGRRRHLYSQVFISSKYKDQFCKHETNFPQLKELSSITELKAESDFGMSSNFIAFNEEKLMSSDCMVFMLRQLPQTIFDFKDFVKNIHDKYGENAYIYIKAYPGPGSSVTFDGC